MILSKYGRVAVASVAALLLPLSALAQEEETAGPSLLQVRVVNTTAAGSAKWIDLQKQAAADIAEGDPGRDVWQVVRGELDTFHIVSPLANYAALDGDFQRFFPELQAQAGRILSTLVRQRATD